MFRSSGDYRRLIRAALPSALNGDGRAAWYIAKAVSECALIVKQYRGSEDAEDQLQRELDSMSGAPQWSRDVLAQRTRRCIGLAKGDPFQTLPGRQGGYTSEYWYDQAVTDGEPLALERRAAATLNQILVTRDMPDDQRSAELAVVNSDLRTAVHSGDPDAMYQAGILLADGRLSNSPENGIAIALAACDLGSDCTSDNPEGPLYNCRISGQCTSGIDYPTVIQHDFDPETYARVYSKAQQIEQSVRAGDWDVVMADITLDKLH